METLNVEKQTIVITDPCHFFKNEITEGRPLLETWPGLEHICGKTPEEYTEEEIRALDEYNTALVQWGESYQSDFVITNNGRDLDKIGLKNYIIMDGNNIINLEIYRTSVDSVIGTFNCDCGALGVFLYDEILAYNPSFAEHKRGDNGCVILEKYTGSIHLEKETIRGEYTEDNILEDGTIIWKIGDCWEKTLVKAVGRGTMNFSTRERL